MPRFHAYVEDRGRIVSRIVEADSVFDAYTIMALRWHDVRTFAMVVDATNALGQTVWRYHALTSVSRFPRTAVFYVDSEAF